MKSDEKAVHFAEMPVSCTARSCDKAGKTKKPHCPLFVVWSPSAALPAAAPLRLERSAGGCKGCASPIHRPHKRPSRRKRPYFRCEPISTRTPYYRRISRPIDVNAPGKRHQSDARMAPPAVLQKVTAVQHHRVLRENLFMIKWTKNKLSLDRCGCMISVL